MTEVLLDRETSNGAALELRPGRVRSEELALDMDREIADPAGDPDEGNLSQSVAVLQRESADCFPSIR
jgi:hypothetical protein